MKLFSGGTPLTPPPIAAKHDAVEIARIWTRPDDVTQVVLDVHWDMPAMWGMVLADLARHVVNAYGRYGGDEAKVFEQMMLIFHAELEEPTSPATDITDPPAN